MINKSLLTPQDVRNFLCEVTCQLKQDEGFCTFAQASKKFGLHPKTLRNYIKNEGFPIFRKSLKNNKVIIKIKDAVKWLDERGISHKVQSNINYKF